MSRIVDTIRNPVAGEGQVETSSKRQRRSGRPELGVVSYFHLGDRDRVERVVDGLTDLGIHHLRTAVSWHDYVSAEGPAWYSWLLPKLLSRFTVMPCVLYTPTHLGIQPKTSSPPRDPADYGDFVGGFLDEYRGAFAHVELWNEPNNFIEWDWTVDPSWTIFAEMVAGAAKVARERDVVPVLGGMSPLDPNWLNLMFERGAMADIGVLGVHGFPGTWEAVWNGWDAQVGTLQEVLDQHDSPAEIWVTECGFSTWHHDEYRMLTELVDVARAPVPRVYWYSADDLPPERSTLDGFHADERAYHFGLFRIDGSAKLPARVWRDRGFDELERLADLPKGRVEVEDRRATLITGGAGFIGTNLADRLAREGKPVVVLDNLSRPGVEANLQWLLQEHPDLVRAEIGDIRDRFAIRRAVDGCDEVFHLAAQVAVTSSIVDPVSDFDVNLLGTMNVLEEIRQLDAPPPVVFTSTNKVYGNLEDVDLVQRERRYEPEDPILAARGIGETRALDFCSPYGCSKGAADQYVLDYAKTYGLRTAVLRMSCIYGPHQHGNEDQGWVAHFMIRALGNEPITIYGDGKQVRDLLYIEDLLEALLLAARDNRTSGRAFNLGGGPENSVSLLEVLDVIASLRGVNAELSFSDGRVGDQRYYVSDTSSFATACGWEAQTPVRSGLEKLFSWLSERTEARSPVAAARTSASRT